MPVAGSRPRRGAGAELDGHSRWALRGAYRAVGSLLERARSPVGSVVGTTVHADRDGGRSREDSTRAIALAGLLQQPPSVLGREFAETNLPRRRLTSRVIIGGRDGEDGATVDAARVEQDRARDAGAFRAAAEDRPEACSSLPHRVAMRRGSREARPGEADGRVSIHGLASLARVQSARPSRRDLSTLQQTFLRREGARHRGLVRESARSRCCASGAETRRWQGARPSHSSATAQGAQRSQRRWIGVRTSRQSWVRLLAPARRPRLPGARVRYARRHRSPWHARKV